jgi:phage tail sheath gpL-like
MALDASLEARTVGVGAEYKPSRTGAARKLPQRLYLIAQGETGASFSTTKFTATSANQVGNIAGYKSPAYAMIKELLPRNGDGVGTVPVTVCLLEDAETGVNAVGDITPSGTATEAAEYRVNVSEVVSDPFTIPAGAVDVSATCVKVWDAITGKLGMPVTPTFSYGTVTAVWTRAAGASDGTIGTFTTSGQPRPGVWSLLCTAAAVDGGTFSLTDPDGTVVSTSLTVGAQSAGGLGFTLTDGSEDFNVGDVAAITVPATDVQITAGWAGVSGNAIYLSIEGPDVSVGVEWAFTQPTGGLVNPTVDAALAQVGNVWETMVLNGLNISDTTALDTYQDWGDGRWEPTVKKPVLVFTGAFVTTVASAIAIPDARKTDKINVQLVAPGCRNLPQVIAARQVARIVRLANNTPPHDYCLRRADGLVPGADGDQWDLTSRDQAVKGGSSTIEVIDGEVRLSNIVTFYHPTGEDPPAYRYVVDVVKLQNCVYAVNQLFEAPEWAGAPLVPDNQVVTEPTAKKPKMAKAALGAVLDGLGLAAIISDPATAKANVSATINSTNAKRLDITAPIQLSGNTNIIDATLSWSFFFGTPAAL